MSNERMDGLKRNGGALLSWLTEGSESKLERWLRVIAPLILGSFLSGGVLSGLQSGGHQVPAYEGGLIAALSIAFVAAALFAIASRVPQQAVERLLRNELSIDSVIQVELDGGRSPKDAAIRRILQACRVVSGGKDIQTSYMEWNGSEFIGIAGDPQPDANFYAQCKRLSDKSCARDAAVGVDGGAPRDIYVPDVTKSPTYFSPRNGRIPRGSLICIPVVRNGITRGVVCASAPKTNAFSSNDQDLMGHYSETISLVYAIVDLQERAPMRLADSAQGLYEAATEVVDRVSAGQILNTDLRFTARPDTENKRQVEYLSHLKTKLEQSDNLACLRVVGAGDRAQCDTLKAQSAPLLEFRQEKLDMRFVRRNPLGIDILVTRDDLLLAFTGLHANRTGILIKDANIAGRIYDWFKQYVWAAPGYVDVNSSSDFDAICDAL